MANLLPSDQPGKVEGMDPRPIIRVFPRLTAATPNDEYAYVGQPPLWWPPASAVHVSVAFTFDLEYAQVLAEAWAAATGLPTHIGGPATGMAGQDFTPGMYLGRGYVITSRGCPNHCWFCQAWRRDGPTRPLPITEGWIVADDNLLACPPDHIEAVFAMLARQPERAVFSGGLDPARLEAWHAEALYGLKPARLWLAYDTPADLEPLRQAADRLIGAGFLANRDRLGCYVLVGYPGDTIPAAEQRMRQAWDLGLCPFAMLYQDDESGSSEPGWGYLKWNWANPVRVAARLRAEEARESMEQLPI